MFLIHRGCNYGCTAYSGTEAFQDGKALIMMPISTGPAIDVNDVVTVPTTVRIRCIDGQTGDVRSYRQWLDGRQFCSLSYLPPFHLTSTTLCHLSSLPESSHTPAPPIYHHFARLATPGIAGWFDLRSAV